METIRAVGREAAAKKYDLLSAMMAYALAGEAADQRLVLRLMALIIAVNGLVVSAVTRARIVSRMSSPWVDLTAVKELSYTMFSIGSFFIFEGIYFAYIYVSLHSFILFSLIVMTQTD